MQMALVRGRATSTVKHPSFQGRKLLICELLDAAGNGAGDPVLAVDNLGAGLGDRVLLTSDGQGLREMLGDTTSPGRWWTIGILDE